LVQYCANYSTGFVIATVASKIGQRYAALGAFHKKRIAAVRQYSRCTPPLPPNHEEAAALLLVVDGYFEHGRQAIHAYRQKFLLASLGERKPSGRVVNTRLAIRKNRAGPQGQEYPFRLREVQLGLDEDGDPMTTMVIDWQVGPAPPTTPQAPTDRWEQSRQADTRQAMLLLKRVLMSMLAKEGLELPSEADAPMVRMIDQEIVRREFYARTAADGTEDEKRKIRAQRFRRTVNRAEEQQLIGLREINGITYLWLVGNQPDEEF
jgi:hypothetical protein